MSHAIQTLKATLAKQLASTKKFTDDQFPPKASLILGSKYAKNHLRRISDLLAETRVISDNIKPTDIEEGSLKNGYFLSALAILAEDPSLVKRLFLTEESNKVGLYALWLNENGTWKPTLVDDHIPCSHRSGSYFPLFAQSVNDELWVSLLEKAYAKVYGSYANIEGGSVAHALRDLTGAPIEEVSHESDVEKVWEVINDAIKNKYILCCSNDVQHDEKQGDEIVSTFSYAVLGAQEIEHEGENVRIVKVRNPWKSFEWTGAWSNESELWTQELRESVNYTEEEASHGIFWISIEDYVDYFPITTICKYKANNNYSSVDLYHDNTNSTVLRIYVPEKQEVTISLNQRDSRTFNHTEEKYKYSYARLLLGKTYDEGLGYIAGNASESHRNLQITETLKPGTYILTVELHWNQDFCRSFNISFYSEADLEIEAVPSPDLLMIQKSIILSSIEKVESSRKVKSYGKYGDSQIEKTEGAIHGLLYFYYLNNSKKGSKLHEKVSFSNIEHINVCSPFFSNEQVEVTVVPDHEVLVLYKADREDHAWSYATPFTVKPADVGENFSYVPQEPYDYVDEENQRLTLNVNEDYNEYIKTGHEEDGKDEKEIEERLKEGIQTTLEKTFPNEKKSASKLNKSTLSSAGKSSKTNPNSAAFGSPSGFYKDSPLSGSKASPSVLGGEVEESFNGKSPVKRYPAMKMQTGQTNSKKIPYTNYDGHDKDLEIFCSNPRLIQIKNPKIRVKSGESTHLRLRFCAPKTLGVQNAEIEIRSAEEGCEEVLCFTLQNDGTQ